MLETITVSALIPAGQRRLYEAWLDGAEHTAFTGSEAIIDPTVGGKFTAWDNYIEGTTLELEPYRRIVQSWRSTDFPEDSQDSRLEVTFDEAGAETRVTIVHSDIPEGQGADYERGWFDAYFEPMTEYFRSLPGE